MEPLQQFEALFNHATIGIVLCNKDAEIINFNAQAEVQFGYTKDELLGKKIEILLPTKYRASHVADRNHFYAHPQNRVMGHGRDLHGQKKDGTEFPVEVSLSHYKDKNQVYVIAFVIDITVRKNDELAVLKHREELQQITTQITQLNVDLEQKVENRTRMLRETLSELEKSKKEVTDALEKEKELGDLKSGFVTMASHEFRTPLTTIMSSAFLLSKLNGPEEGLKREKHINRIREAVNDMKSILEDFLSLGKLEEGSVKAKFQLVSASDLRQELENTIEAMMQIAKKNQTIHFSHTGEEDIVTDINLLKNIVINLCSNAIKFSPENASIDVSSVCEEGLLTLSVKDQGMGISGEDQEHLFERFFRAKNAANIQGTGLGLHIVAKYLELMNGTIELKSELEKGTEFIIKIPKAVYEKDPADRGQ
jgi:PAS domain S-box-containing protein